MRTFQAQRGSFLCIAAALICLYPRFVSADGESVTASSSESSSLSASDLGLGVFTHFPFHFSFSATGGCDDNANTTHFAKQDSWFTTVSAICTYDLGTPRTKLNLSSTTGFSYYFATVNNQYEP